VCPTFVTKSSQTRASFSATIEIVRELPLTRRQIAVAAAAVVAVLFLGSRLLLRGNAPAAPPIPTAAATTTANTAGRVLVVDVVGAVRRPGLYRLGAGTRVADALARAGGATSKAQLDLVNLAAPIADGEQIVVPRRGPVAAGAGPSAPGATAGPVHLNTATLEQLDALPGVGPVTAQKILDYRQQHGAFASVEELDAVPGIGPARLEQLKDLVAP
jgi:competence protein ComEA